MEQLSGGPLLHALRRIADLPNLPPAVLKTLEWTLRKDIQEIEKVILLLIFILLLCLHLS